MSNRTADKARKGKPAHRKAVPGWATAHLTASFDAHQKLMQMARLSAQGIQMHLARPGAIRALAKVDVALAKIRGTKESDGEKLTTEEAAARIEEAERDAELAKREIELDFPVLHGQVAIALWSWLENLVKGLLSNWFLHRPASMNAPEVHRLRVRLGDYLQLTKSDQARFLVELLEQDLAPPSKQGVARFNGLLGVVGLSASVADDDARALFELHRVRNNLVHRNGRVDAKLRSECPWLRQKAGSELRVSRKMLGAYANASAAFQLELIHRIGDVYGVDTRKAVSGTKRKPTRRASELNAATASSRSADADVGPQASHAPLKPQEKSPPKT